VSEDRRHDFPRIRVIVHNQNRHAGKPRPRVGMFGGLGLPRLVRPGTLRLSLHLQRKADPEYDTVRTAAAFRFD
jgi:hypothetical protein